MTDYFLNKEKENVESILTVSGFSFTGVGQNAGLAFIKLKDWSERTDTCLINTLQRENFTKPRKGKDDGKMSPSARAKALGLSLGIFLVGVSACSYVLYQLYDIYFITHADSAQVEVQGQQVAMPREGSVQSLVVVVDRVAKGAPVATSRPPC